MSCKHLVAIAVTLFLVNDAPAGEMDNDRPGTAPVVIVAAPTPAPLSFAATEMDRESPTQTHFLYRPFWGWYRPWGFGFNYFYTYNFFYYRPFFPAFGWPYYYNFGFYPYYGLWW